MTPALAPMGWTQFNLPGVNDLGVVNARVNARIEPREADATKPWRIVYGDDEARDGACHEYAVTKRAELLGIGWPASRLLLTEVAYSATEDHMVLVAVDSRGTQWVLDNLRPDVVPWPASGYRLTRQQSADDPNLWVAL